MRLRRGRGGPHGGAGVVSLMLGAVADDFTGATDLANTLVCEGMSVVQTVGVPDRDAPVDAANAVVVALKSRTSPAEEAVAQSLDAVRWLRDRGAGQIVFKYCSTFDSTAHGNIGPVADALLHALASDFALVCPAFPANGRTVYMGTLFVGEVPLAESSMRDHPLTPMRDSSLIRLMEAQSRHRAGLIPLAAVRAGPAAIRSRIQALKEQGVRYGVVDALTEEDLRAIGAACPAHVLVTGGSGVALGLPANFHPPGRALRNPAPAAPEVSGRGLVIAGSCSAATRAQIDHARSRWPARKLDIDRLAAEADEVGEAVGWALAQAPETPVLVYGSADPAEVRLTQERYGAERAGALMEAALARVAESLHAHGFARIVVAGGETAGAVTRALGIRALRIGPQIAPGVPWTEALGGAPLALALKSGNFGGETFFEDAFAMIR